MRRKISIRKDVANPTPWCVMWIPEKPNHRGIFYRPVFATFPTWAEAVRYVGGIV